MAQVIEKESLGIDTNGSFATSEFIGIGQFTLSPEQALANPTGPQVTMTGITSDLRSDHDFFHFTVPETDVGTVSLAFDLTNLFPSVDTTYDPLLRLYRSDGTLVASNDNHTGLDPFLIYTPMTAGTYYIEVAETSADKLVSWYSLNITWQDPIGVQTSDWAGTLGPDQIEGDFQGDVIADNLDGFAGNDTLSGYGASDTLRGGDGADVVDGGEGNDLLIGDQVPGVSTPVFDGAAHSDTLIGGPGDDSIFGDNGHDTLVGGAGNDRIAGSSGNDTIDGGEGADVYLAAARFGDLNVIAYNTGDDVYVLRPGDSRFTGFDVFEVGTQAAFDGAGVAGGDQIDLRGLGGSIFLSGELAVGPGIGTLIGGASNGRMDAVVNNLSGVVTWFAIDLDDDGRLTDADLLVKFNAAISLVAADFGASDARDARRPGSGNDSILGGTDDDFIRGGLGRDTLRGMEGRDYLMGEGGADFLHGQESGDALSGGNGRDVLTGGLGVDVLDGGDGADRFVFASMLETGATRSTRDRIVDFEVGMDRIDLSRIDAISGGGGANDTFAFQGTAGFTGAGQVMVLQSGANTLVRISVDADSAPEATILLLNVTASTITAGSFIL